MKEQKGITLIALVITIIVLLILAGVTIAMLSGNNSAPQKAQAAAADTKVAEAKEQAAMDVVKAYTDYMDGKYNTNTVTEANFLAYAKKANIIPASRDNMYTYATGTATFTIQPKTSDNKTVTGTIQEGGSINWTKN